MSSAVSTGALERKNTGFVGAALKALQSTAAALPRVKTSDAIAAVLSLAKPKDSASASSQKVHLAASQSYRWNVVSTMPYL